ncbi:hypothetical protein FGG08_002641 [Glutinoglossum americanum]|uniref:Clr5 domain-containing protein n=1 Tax=Glutinoglossum americanum TaxID=1670608 RepID=A0A9P8I4B9_9PEZI|nr:hypothetical protein FGG08_002641 [Glutinoglossum americanum]
MPQQQLQWKGPPAKRAKPVPAEKWEEHKEELCRLYRDMVLDDLITMMKARHGFAPSRRQYIFRFEKWGVRKHKITGKDSIKPECYALPSQHSSDTRVDQGSGDSDPFQTSITQTYPAKRQQSLHEKPAVPPKKRQKLSDFMSSKDPYADLGSAFDTPDTPKPSPQDLLPSGRTARSPSSTFPSIVGGRADSVTYTSSSLGDNSGLTTPNDTSDAGMLPPRSEGSNGSRLGDIDRPTSQQYSVGRVFPRERRLDSSRPIDTFSPDEIQDMKRAADFLFSLSFDMDSFALYALILKRLKDSSNQPAWVTSTAMVSCARSATTSSQVEIAQSLLEQKLHEPHRSATDVENFLFRMLLAETYTRRRDYSTANFHTRVAMESDLADERLLTQLPQETRSLDIITYHCLARGLGCHENLVKEKTLRYLPQDNLFIGRSQVQERLLLREPGPFELKHGSMKNPCIRSCLQWCTSELERTATIPGSWKNLQSNDQHLSWAEHIGVYCCLWERWQSRQTKYTKLQPMLWAGQAERLMGISAAELLITSCWMIMGASPSRNDKSECDLVRRARIGAKFLSQQSDEKLGCQFLDTFSWMNTLIHASPEQKAFQNIARSYARDLVEKSLMVKLPEMQDSETEETPDTPLQSDAPRRSLSIVAAALLPTLASSLHSSDLSSLRKLGDRIQQGFEGMVQDAVSTLPSSVFRGPSRSYLSLPSISELSQAMASSLGLSSLQ